MRKALGNFVAGWKEAQWIYRFAVYLLLSILLTTFISGIVRSRPEKPDDFELLLALVAGWISFYLAKLSREQRKLNDVYSRHLPPLLGITLPILCIFILGIWLRTTHKSWAEFVNLAFILAGVVLTHSLTLYSQFYRESQGYIWLAARQIWAFLLMFIAIEWVLGGFFFYLTRHLPSYVSIPAPLWAGVIGIIVAAIPTASESILLPKEHATVETLRGRLTRLLLKLNILPRYNFARAIEYCREQDVYDCQQPDSWGLGLHPSDVGRRIRKLYEFSKYRIAEERGDPSLLFYDVGRSPWDQFYLLSRYMGRKRLREYISNPVFTHYPTWDGRERRRRVGTRADRVTDPNPSRFRMYDDSELISNILRGRHSTRTKTQNFSKITG